MIKKRFSFFAILTIPLLWIVVVVVLFTSSSCAQNSHKIKIIPSFFDIPNNYRGNLINKPQDLKGVVLDGVLKRNNSGFLLNVWDLSKEEVLDLTFSFPVPNDPKLFDADFFLWGTFNEREGLINLDLVSVKTARSITTSIDLKKLLRKAIADEIIDAILLMLSDEEKISQLATIKAEEIIDPSNSVVGYMFRTVEGVDLRISIEYNGSRDYVWGFKLEQINNKFSAPTQLRLTCEDGNFIYVNLDSGRKFNPKRDISTSFIPKSNTEITKEFIVKSKENYEIVFQFTWKDGSVGSVQVFPKTNPYEPQTRLLSVQ